MKYSLFSFLRSFGVVALAFVLANEAVLGDEESAAPSEPPVEVPIEMTDAPSLSPTEMTDAPSPSPSLLKETSESPVEVPTEMTDAPSPAPTFKEGDAPVVFQPGDIAQPIFQSPVAPPPISEAGRIDGIWMVTLAAMILAAAF